MKRITLTIFILLSVGCGFSDSTHLTRSNLEQHRETFEETYSTDTSDVEFRIVTRRKFREKVGGGSAAACQKVYYNTGETTKTIYFNKYVDGKGKYSLEHLVFHELAHCAFDVPHNDETLWSGGPKSLMYPDMFHKHQYNRKRPYYHDQLGEMIAAERR